MAIKRVLTQEQDKEFQQLYEEFAAATVRAAAALQTYAVATSEFSVADHAAGEIMERLNKLIGRHHWMG